MSQISNRHRLQMLGLPVMETVEDFSRISHLSAGLIKSYASFAEKSYCEFKIPKKGGGERLIAHPSKKLKALQSWILRSILDHLNVSAASKGFRKGHSLVHNVKPHLGANVILSIDLKDFFPSIISSYIYTVFYSVGYNSHISLILTSLCTFKDRLPQGSPCSPALANLVCLKLDNRIQGYVGKRGITYTRYADDLTFSGSTPQKLFYALKTIEKIVNDEGFELNKNKTRIRGPRQRRKITGLVVSEDKFGIGRYKYRLLRAKIFRFTKTRKEQIDLRNLNHIEGWMAFVRSVDKASYNKLSKYIKGLQIKHKESAISLVEI